MRQKSNSTPASSETLVRNIRRATRNHHAAEEKIRIVLDGLLHKRTSFWQFFRPVSETQLCVEGPYQGPRTASLLFASRQVG